MFISKQNLLRKDAAVLNFNIPRANMNRGGFTLRRSDYSGNTRYFLAEIN